MRGSQPGLPIASPPPPLPPLSFLLLRLGLLEELPADSLERIINRVV